METQTRAHGRGLQARSGGRGRELPVAAAAAVTVNMRLLVNFLQRLGSLSARHSACVLPRDQIEVR